MDVVAYEKDYQEGVELLKMICLIRQLKYEIIRVTEDLELVFVRDKIIGNTFWTHADNIVGGDFDEVRMLYNNLLNEVREEEKREMEKAKELNALQRILSKKKLQEKIKKMKENIARGLTNIMSPEELMKEVEKLKRNIPPPPPKPPSEPTCVLSDKYMVIAQLGGAPPPTIPRILFYDLLPEEEKDYQEFLMYLAQKVARDRKLNYKILYLSDDYSSILVEDASLGSIFWTSTNNIFGTDNIEEILNTPLADS